MPFRKVLFGQFGVVRLHGYVHQPESPAFTDIFLYLGHARAWQVWRGRDPIKVHAVARRLDGFLFGAARVLVGQPRPQN